MVGYEAGRSRGGLKGPPEFSEKGLTTTESSDRAHTMAAQAEATEAPALEYSLADQVARFARAQAESNARCEWEQTDT